MSKPEVIFGTWKFVKTDPLNWQIFEYSEIQSGKRKGELDWVKRPNYFGELKYAVVYARNRDFERGLDTTDIDGAIERFEKVDTKFLKAISKALKEVDL